MRVLHFYKTYKPDSMGGVEQLIGEICSGSARRGVPSDVLTLSQDTSTVDLGDHMHYRAKLDFKLASSYFSVSSLAKLKQLAAHADIVHYHFPWPFMDMAHFLTRLKKPTVVTYHSDIIRQKTLLQFYRPLMLSFLGSVTRIVATSPNYAQTSPILRRYANKVQVIPIGLNEETYPQASPAKLAEWRARVGPKFLLFVGMLRYYKGLHILLESLKGSDHDVVILGGGPLEGELKQQAQSLGLRRVHFVGALPDEDKFALLTLCHGLVFPSHLRSEAFGISLLEGAMYGKPLISCEIGTGTSYVNVANETGLVVPPADPLALRAAIDRIWNDDLLAAQLGAAARQRFCKMFTADKMADAYVNLYRHIATSR
ncbi:glycosyltransferase [Paraburkholderia hospita]|uniref:glycosyltransferase n=1 Tax=Paraburkholderia hospita TaxID=169430 RepID=UPI0009A58C74|nr:glycosyltransferase [Paraburkholderia hospita]SKC63661.1 rhamnosyl/mannosyltransferase [Paraburkholderia hospita]